MWNCCRYHVVVLHCIVSRLAMCHSRVFSLEILEVLSRCKDFALTKMSSWVSHAWNICLRKKCVDVRLLSISCSFLSFHSLAFSDVSQSCVQSRELGGPQKVQGFTLTQMYPRVSHAWKTNLHKKCVDVRLLSISCSFLALHRLAFSNVPQSRFQSRDLGGP